MTQGLPGPDSGDVPSLLPALLGCVFPGHRTLPCKARQLSNTLPSGDCWDPSRRHCHKDAAPIPSSRALGDSSLIPSLLDREPEAGQGQ